MSGSFEESDEDGSEIDSDVCLEGCVAYGQLVGPLPGTGCPNDAAIELGSTTIEPPA